MPGPRRGLYNGRTSLAKGIPVPAIVLKGVPADLHRRLREQAERNRRSMNQELLTIMERALRPLPPLKPIRPVKTRQAFTHAWLLKAVREGRE